MLTELGEVVGGVGSLQCRSLAGNPTYSTSSTTRNHVNTLKDMS